MNKLCQYLVGAALALTCVGHAYADARDRHGHAYTEVADDPTGGVFNLKISVSGVEGTPAEIRELSRIWRLSARRICKGNYSGAPEAVNTSINWDGLDASGKLVGGSMSVFDGVLGLVTCQHRV